MISRRKFIYSLAGAAVSGFAWDSFANRTLFPEACKISTVTVGGPAGWVGKTALFISDIHFNHRFGTEDTDVLVQMAKAENPDVIFMGGDLAHTLRTDLSGFFQRWSLVCPVLFAPRKSRYGKKTFWDHSSTGQGGRICRSLQ